jgi:hypothetical protein
MPALDWGGDIALIYYGNQTQKLKMGLPKKKLCNGK